MYSTYRSGCSRIQACFAARCRASSASGSPVFVRTGMSGGGGGTSSEPAFRATGMGPVRLTPSAGTVLGTDPGMARVALGRSFGMPKPGPLSGRSCSALPVGPCVPCCPSVWCTLAHIRIRRAPQRMIIRSDLDGCSRRGNPHTKVRADPGIPIHDNARMFTMGC